MTIQLSFIGREHELQLIHTALHTATTTRTPQIVTFVAETGVGKSRIIQEFYRQLTISTAWDPDNFWPDAFQSHATQLRVNPEFPAEYAPNGPPKFLWLGVRWHNFEERNVANSLALPTIKEQLVAFNQRITDMRSRWQRVLEAGKEEVRKLATIRGALNASLKFVPYGDAISNMWEYGEGISREILSIQSAPQTLPDQLMELYQKWFQTADATPIILWLDDAQWIDVEATEFFTLLMRTARTKRWPILLVATSWPMEWNKFDDTFFLKHDTSTTLHIDNAADAELRELLRVVFPQLPSNQVDLLVDKAGGNFLTMMENINELQMRPRYFFVNSDISQPLSSTGMLLISSWESNRQRRITQRFHAFDEDVQDFLARASRAGLNTQFLQRVLLRCNEIYPDEARVYELIKRCQTELAVITPTTSSLHEFRDRGYFAVAQQHFVQLLQAGESTPLHDALITEITERVQSAFDEYGDLRNPRSHHTSLRAASSKEQYIILDLALTLLTPNTPTHVQALIAMVERHVTENAWEEIRSLVRGTASQHYFDATNWHDHADKSVSWNSIHALANATRDAGALTQASILYQLWLDYRRMQHATYNTLDTLRNLSVALNNIGGIHQSIGDIPTAQTYFSEALDIKRQLVSLWSTPDYIRNLSVSLNWNGRIHESNGDLNAARSCFVESLATCRKLVSIRGTPDDQRDLCYAISNVGRMYKLHGDIDSASTYFAESLSILRHIVSLRGNHNELRDLSVTLNLMGQVHRDNADSTNALSCFSESLSILRRIVSLRGTPADLRELTSVCNGIGRIHHTHGHLSSALEYFSQAINTTRQLVETRGTPDDLRDLVITLNLVGRIHYDNGHLSSALDCFSQALTTNRRLITLYSMTTDMYELTTTLNNIGRIQQAYGNLLSALEYFSEALNTARQLVEIRRLPDDLQNLACTLNLIGRIYHINGDLSMAINTFIESLTIARQVVSIRGRPDDLCALSITRKLIGQIHQDNSDEVNALIYFTESLDILRQLISLRTIAGDLYELAATLNNIGRIHLKNRALPTALISFTEALNTARQLSVTRGIPNDVHLHSITLNLIGKIHQENGDNAAALAIFYEALGITRQLVNHYRIPDYLRELTVSLNNIGHINRDNGDITTAFSSFSESLCISREIVNTRGIPEDLKRLFESLIGVSVIHHANSDVTAALASATEALDVAHQVQQRTSHIISAAELAHLERRIAELS